MTRARALCLSLFTPEWVPFPPDINPPPLTRRLPLPSPSCCSPFSAQRPRPKQAAAAASSRRAPPCMPPRWQGLTPWAEEPEGTPPVRPPAGAPAMGSGAPGRPRERPWWRPSWPLSPRHRRSRWRSPPHGPPPTGRWAPGLPAPAQAQAAPALWGEEGASCCSAPPRRTWRRPRLPLGEGLASPAWLGGEPSRSHPSARRPPSRGWGGVGGAPPPSRPSACRPRPRPRSSCPRRRRCRPGRRLPSPPSRPHRPALQARVTRTPCLRE